MIRAAAKGAGVWWLHPAAIFGIAGTLTGLISYALPESIYRTYWGTPKFYTAGSLEITLACVAVFVFGSLLSSRLASASAWPESRLPGDQLPLDVLEKVFSISFLLSLLGYTLWAGLAVSRGMTLSTVIGVVTGEKGAMYDARFTYLTTVGGVTTLTQFGTATMILGAVIGCRRGWGSVRWRLITIGILALVRAFVNSERFALIELLVPFGVAYLVLRYMGSRKIGPITRSLVNFAPFLGGLGLFLIFTGFEYFRSWTNYYSAREQSLLGFGAMRLFGYYVTSFNNGAYLLDRLNPLNAPYFTLHFLWGFPLSAPVIRRLFISPLLESTDKWFYFPFLEADANVEFNNADGMFFPLMDYGVAGGLIYWLLMGVLCGWLYEAYCRRHLTGLLLYPATLLGLIECPLALYWGEGRAFPSLLLLAATPLVLWLLRRSAFPGRSLPRDPRMLQPNL